MSGITVQQWKDMFTEIGLSEETMARWHQIFERRHPQAHGSFLAWLGLSGPEIKKIKQQQ
jgi:hypothetical protein